MHLAITLELTRHLLPQCTSWLHPVVDALHSSAIARMCRGISGVDAFKAVQEVAPRLAILTNRFAVKIIHWHRSVEATNAVSHVEVLPGSTPVNVAFWMAPLVGSIFMTAPAGY
jgi:hypothetical protein